MTNGAEIVKAVRRLGALRFFPSDEYAREEIMNLIERMVSSPEQLEWLVRVMIDKVGTWPGTAELRGVFCTRFKPLDGVEGWSSVAGFSAADSEAAYMRQLAAPAGRRELPSAAELKMLPLPPEEIAENHRLLRKVEHSVKAVPQATAADREYSRNLLAEVLGLPERSAVA